MNIKNLEKYRVESPMFNMTFPPDNILGVEAGPTVAKSEGMVSDFGTAVFWNS
jgi:hypothetical protein